MKDTVTEYTFTDTMINYGFSYEGTKALFEHLEQSEIELDVIALCCDYNEWESLKEFQEQYNDDYKTIKDIEQATQVIRIDDDKFITQAF